MRSPRRIVPRVSVVTRKAYGGAYIAMNSKSLDATAVFAWAGAEVAVMGAEAAVGILHRKRLAAVPEEARAELTRQLAEEHKTIAGGLPRAVEARTRRRGDRPGHHPGAGHRGHRCRAATARQPRQHPALAPPAFGDPTAAEKPYA
jgi:hypothetical protein